MQGINVNPTIVDNNVAKNLQQDNKNKDVSTKTNPDVVKYATVGVGALAAIGLATFAILSHKKANLNAKQTMDKVEELTSKKSDLTEKISKLKRDIKSEYLKKRYSARKEISRTYTYFQDKVANGDESELKNAYDEINRYDADMAELSKKIREKFKGKLVTDKNGKQVYQGGLLDDPDWKEVRKLRRLYVKEYEVGNTQNALKLGLANKIIKSKLTGQPIVLNEKELPLDDALKMIRDPKHNNVTIHKYLQDNQMGYLKGKPGVGLDIATCCDPLYISTFSRNADNVIKNYKKIPAYKESIAKAQELKAKSHDITLELAKDTRQSEKVKQLKKLQAQLKNVSDEIASLQNQK